MIEIQSSESLSLELTHGRLIRPDRYQNIQQSLRGLQYEHSPDMFADVGDSLIVAAYASPFPISLILNIDLLTWTVFTKVEFKGILKKKCNSVWSYTCHNSEKEDIYYLIGNQIFK